MAVNYISLSGNVINKGDLTIHKAQEVAETIEKLPYYSLLGFQRLEEPIEGEVIVFEVQVEVGQKVIHDIKNTERIAAVFTSEDNTYPEVWALRDDFPIVPHRNLRPYEKPRSLCLFNEKYSELKLYWTPKLFVERIREWLALTAKGELHEEGQPLEPLLIGSLTKLILPFEPFNQKSPESFELLIIRRVDCGECNFTLIAERGIDVIKLQKELEFIAISIEGQPQPHGIINKIPANLLELHLFLLKAQIDLLSELRKYLPNIKDKESQHKGILNARLILIVNLPKTRHEFGTVEAEDTWAFWLENTIKGIGIEIGIWDIKEGMFAPLITTDSTKKGEEIKTILLNPIPSFSREIASTMNGFPQSDKKEIVFVGAGALGSQTCMNLVRMGFGNWTIIDEDCLLPHNLARHALTGNHLGFSKAEMLAWEANGIIKSEKIADSIVADVLSPSSSEKLKSAYSKARVIIDASASIPVARHLARDIDSEARRVSIFLNPSGSDVVMLAEDEKRKITLDCLEMQYYRYLINESALRNHLQRSDGSIRYARSCRDVSNIIPQDLVALHSAICSRGIRNVVSNSTASISIWKADINDLSIRNYKIPTSDIIEQKFGEWTLYSDKVLLNKIVEARENRLPNETGGILIGSYDMQRKILYVTDTILSPPDSKEYPTAYIRGCKGLKEHVDQIQQITFEMLKYVGEWHSHPRNCDSSLSSDDKVLFNWLDKNMNIDGFSPLLLIVGDPPQHSWYLGKLS